MLIVLVWLGAVLGSLAPDIAAGLLIEARYQVDLIAGLSLSNRSYRGLSVSPSEGLQPSLSTTVFLSGDAGRDIQLPPEVLQRATQILSQSNEFTLMASMKQDTRNAGTILAFSQGNNRFLELQSSGRRDELRLHYSHRDKVLVETFPYRLADGSWHQVAVSVSGTHVTIFVNCSQIYRRVIREVDCQLQNKNLTLWLGQRNLNHFLFKGYLQDVKIVGRSHGYVMQCPHVDQECPTCGQFRQLQVSVFHLESIIQQLNDRLLQAESRLAAVEECECQKHCYVNDSLHIDGSLWLDGCDECTCVHGEVKCQHIKCQETNCKIPVKQPGECCAKCPANCMMSSVQYTHGERVSKDKCMECVCQNGRMDCHRQDPKVVCPKLNCSKSDQLNISGECCLRCRGTDYCAAGHDCHENSICVNGHTKYSCECKTGYNGTGTICTDIDECLDLGGYYGHHCHAHTVCVNTPGSYLCQCLPGYTRQDFYTCVEYDECKVQDHQCDKNARCVNTAGSYQCHCQEGYTGDGFKCRPVCNQTCQNGNCTAPGVCTCQSGYKGQSCDIDIDECSMGTHHCHSDTVCVNMPGWYYCQCKAGYKSQVSANSVIQCHDIDECKNGAHTCQKSANCVNEIGGYRCECINNSTCSLDCFSDDVTRFNGETWHPYGQSCSTCKCEDGVTTCKSEKCDCANPEVDIICCPQCDRSSTCHHQEANIVYRNGDQWIYQCETCECLYGEMDCWPLTCKPARCDNPIIDPSSSCCPICPDDPCSTYENGTKGCNFAGKMYLSGEKVPHTQDPCSSCKCNNGKICCSFMGSCLGADFGARHQISRRSLGSGINATRLYISLQDEGNDTIIEEVETEYGTVTEMYSIGTDGTTPQADHHSTNSFVKDKTRVTTEQYLTDRVASSGTDSTGSVVTEATETPDVPLKLASNTVRPIASKSKLARKRRRGN